MEGSKLESFAKLMISLSRGIGVIGRDLEMAQDGMCHMESDRSLMCFDIVIQNATTRHHTALLDRPLLCFRWGREDLSAEDGHQVPPTIGTDRFLVRSLVLKSC